MCAIFCNDLHDMGIIFAGVSGTIRQNSMLVLNHLKHLTRMRMVDKCAFVHWCAFIQVYVWSLLKFVPLSRHIMINIFGVASEFMICFLREHNRLLFMFVEPWKKEMDLFIDLHVFSKSYNKHSSERTKQIFVDFIGMLLLFEGLMHDKV